jgi:eukaryotic-like serine/threonine-protein kinase
MNDWQRVDALFEQALERPEAERNDFVRSKSADDFELVASVIELLTAAAEMGDFLEGGLPDVSGDVLKELVAVSGTDDDLVGEIIGPFRVLDVLGSGGTSTVYLGERTDPSFHQQVALKVFRTDHAPADLSARVRSERQILASLTHPDLARLFDAGVTEAGRPYLVVELVRGRTVTEYATDLGLSVKDRLDLFNRVGDAVAYAHRNLVVHQDLKPSNILVTDDGHVKLLDFGIAKLMSGHGRHFGADQDAAPQGPERTEPAAPGRSEGGEPGASGGADGAEPGARNRWMTPRYAAPEQIDGRPITTATDVHALGLLLFELLCGGSPFRGVDDGSADPRQAVAETAPTAPSARLGGGRGPEETTRVAVERDSTPSRLVRILSGDLDAIVLKALRKDPGARYATAEALVADLRRYQAGLPVEAREPTPRYQLEKFTRRHSVAVASAAALVALLVAGTGTLSVQRSQTIRERDRANEAAITAGQEADKARAVVAFLGDVFRGRDPSQAPNDTLTALQLVEWGESRLDTEFVDQPEVLVELLEILGGAYRNLGLPERAEPLLARSVEVRRAVYGAESQEVADGLLSLAGHHVLFRNFDAALPPATRAMDILLAVHGPSSPDLVPGLVTLANSLREVGRADSSTVLMRRAIDIGRLAGDVGTPDHTALMLRLAYMLRAADRLDEAEALYREGIPPMRADPDHTPLALSQTLNNLGYLLRLQGDYSGADTLYREAFTISTELYGRDHPTTMLLGTNLAAVLMLSGRPDESIAILEANIESTTAQFGPEHWRVGAALSGLGFAYLQSPTPGLAEEPLRRAVAVYETSLGAEHEWTVFARAHLAGQRIGVGRTTGSADPDSADPDSANPDSANPDSANPDSANPDSADPDSPDLESAGPDRGGLDRADLERVYVMASDWAERGGMSSSGLDLMSRTIKLLDLVGLSGDADRFRALTGG